MEQKVMVMEIKERQSLIRTRVSTILQDSGLSQAAIADRMYIPANVICQYVHKQITPSPARIAEICETFKEDPRWVLGLTDERHKL